MLRAGDQIGPYTLINILGRGAFGTVWLSERRTMIATTTAALKIPLDDDVDLETIKHEANLWVRASGHPNILPIIEANIYDDQVVIASEYAPDGSLEAWLRQHGGKAPSVEAAVEIISGVLAGLEHLHARNIIHRDLKPANILFQGSTPRLADFGISRVLRSTRHSGIVAGTPAYMAPEAFDGKRNEQTDIWSVGVILYLLLTERLPFPQADITSLVGAILSRNPDPLPISISSPLQGIIARALAKDSRQRYQSATEMRAYLRRWKPNAMAIVNCLSCGAKNRVDEGAAAGRQPECGKCGAALNSAGANPKVQYTPKPVTNGQTGVRQHTREVTVLRSPVAPFATPLVNDRHRRIEVPISSSPAGDQPINIAKKRSFLIPAIVAMILMLVVGGIIYFSRFSNRSIEEQLDAAIARGALFEPAGASAYDLYNKLKQNGASENTLARFKDKLLPLLTTQPLKMLVDFAVPTGREPDTSEWQAAVRPMAWASELKPDDQTLAAKAKYIEGRIAFLTNHKDEALKAWKRVIDLDKTWAVPPNSVGVIYNERKDYKTARTYFLEAIRREPNWAAPYNNIGTSYLNENNNDQAESYYQQAIERAPNWPRPHAWLGEIAMRRGDYCPAASEFEAVLNLAQLGTTTINLDEIRKRLELARQNCPQPDVPNSNNETTQSAQGLPPSTPTPTLTPYQPDQAEKARRQAQEREQEQQAEIERQQSQEDERRRQIEAERERQQRIYQEQQEREREEQQRQQDAERARIEKEEAARRKQQRVKEVIRSIPSIINAIKSKRRP